MEYIVVVLIFVIIFLGYEYIKNHSQNKVNNMIEQLLNIIQEYIYNKEILYTNIEYMNLKCEEDLLENKRKVIFYDSIDFEKIQLQRGYTILQEIKKNGLKKCMNREYYVKNIFIEFTFKEYSINYIHILFPNINNNKYVLEYVKNKLITIEKDDDNKNYPKIHVDEYMNIGILYE